MSSKVENGNPGWYNKYVAGKAPNWYQNILKESGFDMDTGTYKPREPETVNTELQEASGPRQQVERVAMKGIKLPGVGAGYKQSQVKSYSYYNQPIAFEGPLRGRSRKWGDVDENAKRDIISQIVEVGRAEGLDKDDIAYVLAIAHVESGFNPDAAAGTTSAHGLGQFINKTGAHYGLSDNNRWNIDEQIRALIEHYKDNKRMAESRKGGDRDYIYAFHHDGPSLAYGGIGLARNKVRPLYEMYRSNVEV